MEEKAPRRRGIYLLPNLITTAGMFCGFYAIIAAESGKFHIAAMAIFIAMIMDGLDGRVARLTNTQSDFGVQYDSLSDCICFGLAPSLVVFSWALVDMGNWGWAKPGWLAAFTYTACGALRLARFNTQVGVQDKRYFQGLPSPAAAAVLASMVWVAQEEGVSPEGLEWLIALVTFGTGLLMVSNFRYHSFKELNFKRRVPFFGMVILLLVIVLVSTNPPIVLFGVSFVYAVSGPVMTLLLRQKRLDERKKAHAEQSDS